MYYDRVLVKYGELTLKGRNKMKFIRHVNETIKNRCRDLKNLRFISNYERFYILLNGESYEEVVFRLNTVFGLHSYSLAAKCRSSLMDIKETALMAVKSTLVGPVTFKVETKRADKNFSLTSLEVSREVAGYVLKNTDFLKVDVKNPEVTLRIEIRDEGSYISTKEIPGLGGLPVGISGKGLLMLSGGIDSPVAGYLSQKRGVEIMAVHFSSFPYTSKEALKKVFSLAEKLTVYAENETIKVFNIPFTKLQKAIYDNCPKDHTIVIMRRMMYRISEIMAKNNQAAVLINGENIGQVASQTLESMAAVNETVSLPVLRPLATMDKLEIISTAKKIATYDISIMPYDDCCTVFIPKNPVTKPRIELCRKYENAFDYQMLIDECIKNAEEITVKKNQDSFLKNIDMTGLF